MADEKTPRISLEHILSVKAASEKAFGLEERARQKYTEFVSAAVKPSIRRRRAFFSRRHFLQEYDLVGKRFFRIGGDYTKIANEAFSFVMQDYDPFLRQALLLAKKAREVSSKFKKIQSAVEPFGSTAAKCLKGMANGGQLLLFPESAEMPSKPAVQNMLYGLRALVEDYSSAMSSLAAAFPYSGAAAQRSPIIAENVTNANRLLEPGSWEFSPFACSETLCSLYSSISEISFFLGRAVLSFENADILSIKWSSDKFAEFFSGNMGFEAHYEKKHYAGRGRRPSYCIRWVQKK